MLQRLIIVTGIVLLLGINTYACTPDSILASGESLPLTSFTENSVDVSVTLMRDPQGNVFLAATFTPPPDHHLYSKDLPRDGMDGLGRPTLLELTSTSKMTALGPLIESIAAIENISEIGNLSMYPIGPVTLRLSISLPPGSGWVEDEISLTFMACSEDRCKPPVVGKIVSVRVPGAESISNP